MGAAPLRMGRLVRADVRFHRGGFVGVAVAIFVATMLVTGLGVLVESGIRGGLAPERYTQVDVVVGASQQAESTAPAEPPPGVPDGAPVPPSGDLPISLPERAVLPDGAADAVAAVPGVASVVADVTVPLVDAAGLVVEAHPWSATALSAVALRDGRAPEAADEVVLAAGPGVEVGVTVLLAHGGERAEYRVVGVLAETGAATRAQHVYLSDDRIAELDPHGGAAQVLGVFVAEGAAPDEVAEAIRAAVPGLSAQTGAGRGDIEFLDSGAARMTLIAIGSAFVGTCILVALFIVAGTLSLSVQARRRDFALLRAVGASPRQVHSLIAREVLSVAGVAAVLGILPGYLLSTALQTAFVQGGVIPGDFALAISPIPAAGALLLVLGSAWGAAAIAARRPARLDPVEALRESATGARSIGLPRIIVGIVLAAAGVSLSTVPLVARGEYARGAAAGAAMVLIVALAVLGPWLVGLVMRLLGAVLRRTTAAGFLAAENSIANSRRMASAILPLALGIGLGLVQVGAPAIVAAEAAAQAEAGVTADLRVSAQAGISTGALGVVSGVPGVTQVNPVTVSMAALDYRDLDGSPMIGEHTLQGIAPDAVSDTLDLRVQSGGLEALDGEHSVAVSADMVQTLGVDLGDTVKGRFGDGTPLEAVVVATYERGLGFGDLTMEADAVRLHTTDALTDFALVAVTDGAASDVRASLESAGLLVQGVGGQKAAGADAQSQQGWVNLVALIVILGYIAIAVINTLVMATAERSRELALLQLIGSSRRQVRAMMRTEAVLIAVIAAVFGVAVAIPPLMGMSIGVSGSPIPALPLGMSGIIIGSMSVLALLALWVATITTMRVRPIDEIGSRQ
ncbi:ABC transporter permease [Microbacterium natoriense]|uniref:ABC transporter permease n=1 Tax=Microbacterium natoriense TaxID=284570 RepID=UPI0031D546AD